MARPASTRSCVMAKKLTQLGRAVAQPASPDKAELEAVPNPHPGSRLCGALHRAGIHHPVPHHRPARFRPFRDRLCAGQGMVESKSLKLFLTSFRNVGGFHEDYHARHRQAHRRGDQAEISAHRAATGIRAAACRSMFSGRRENCRQASGCRSRASRLIAGAASAVTLMRRANGLPFDGCAREF